MDDERGSLVDLSLLKVDHYELSSIHEASKWHHARWIDSHTRAHRDDQVRPRMQLKTLFENASDKVLTEVDNSVLQFTAAPWSVTNAAGFVLLSILGAADSVVSHVLSVTLDTEFEVCVPVELSHDLWVDSTLAVETVDVLTDDALEDAAILQLN